MSMNIFHLIKLTQLIQSALSLYITLQLPEIISHPPSSQTKLTIKINAQFYKLQLKLSKATLYNTRVIKQDSLILFKYHIQKIGIFHCLSIPHIKIQFNRVFSNLITLQKYFKLNNYYNHHRLIIKNSKLSQIKIGIVSLSHQSIAYQILQTQKQRRI